MCHLHPPPRRALPSAVNKDWVLASTSYGEEFISAVAKGAVYATQFHPEKSGPTGLRILGNFLNPEAAAQPAAAAAVAAAASNGNGNGTGSRGLAKRVIACLDVRSNDRGDLVVTKGDQ